MFHICGMDADGSAMQQLTAGTLQNLTATWSPDGQQIVFNKILPPLPPTFPNEVMNYQLFTITLNDSPPVAKEITCAPEQNSPDYPGLYHCPSDVTPTQGINLLAHWGVLRVKS